MKIVLFAFTALIGFCSSAQTAIIAHKSHSGTAAGFSIDPSTNFGEPGPQLVQIVRLNDSTYIQVFSEFSGMIYHDTVRKNSPSDNYNSKVDSIYQQDYYKEYIEYINLKNSADTARIKVPRLQLLQIVENETVTPKNQDIQPINEESAPKKKEEILPAFPVWNYRGRIVCV